MANLVSYVGGCKISSNEFCQKMTCKIGIHLYNVKLELYCIDIQMMQLATYFIEGNNLGLGGNWYFQSTQ